MTNFAKKIDMKTKFVSALILLTVLFSGCKNEKSVDDLKVVIPEVVDNTFKVVIDVIVKKDDDFALYYTEDGTINFYNIEPVWQGVKGSENSQQVTFIVPEDVSPTEVRLDFGLKNEQEDIILKNFTISYKGKTFNASGADIFKYFVADENQCTADPATGTIKAKVKDGKRLTPSLYPSEGGGPLGKQIELLFK